MRYLDVFLIKFKITFLIFQIPALKFVKLKNFKQKQKRINLPTNMPYLAIFFGRIFKRVLSYLKTAPSNLSNCKILQKYKTENTQKCVVWMFFW